MRVDVYWNLHKGGYSIREHGGKVIGHASEVSLIDCKFTVRETARQKVIRDRCKSVHAWIEGTLVDDSAAPGFATRISYNPYKAATFVTDGGCSQRVPVYSAKRVRCITAGGKAQIYAQV